MVHGSGFRFQGLGLRVEGLGCRVQGSGFRAQGPGCRVQGFGFRGQSDLKLKKKTLYFYQHGLRAEG